MKKNLTTVLRTLTQRFGLGISDKQMSRTKNVSDCKLLTHKRKHLGMRGGIPYKRTEMLIGKF